LLPERAWRSCLTRRPPQILSTAFPELKKLQREEGPAGRARFSLYNKLATLAFATAQAVGALTVLRCVQGRGAGCKQPRRP